jgi:hypothetical protein
MTRTAMASTWPIGSHVNGQDGDDSFLVYLSILQNLSIQSRF